MHVDNDVVALGRQGNDEISAEEMAGWATTINHEVTAAILSRLTQVYLQDGRVIETRTLVAE